MRAKAASVSSLTLAALALGASGVWAVLDIPRLDVGTCAIPQRAVGWPYWLAFVVTGVSAFAVGGWAARWRDWSRELDPYDPPGHAALTVAAARAADRRHRRRAWIVQLFLVLGFAVTTGFLAYETWAVYAGPPTSAITDFVRCASSVATVPTLLASAAILFLVGHWLWHPVRERRREATSP
jgi:hypothetical protein